MSRGDHREDIFAGSPHRQLFLETLEEACAKTDRQIHAFCLMSNHFDLVVETPKANRILKAELERLGWTEAELERRRKGEPKKVRIATRLRRETTMTLGWVAQRLPMGTQPHMSHLL